jgi:hypothetical protein
MSVSFIVIFFKQFNKCRLYNIRMYDKLIKGIIKFIENWFLYKRHMNAFAIPNFIKVILFNTHSAKTNRLKS